MMSHRVSCVVPVCNGERFLGEALDSILAQTHLPTELIVVDDGSTDRSQEIAESYGDRVVLLRQPNRGPAAARNRGIRAARGELLAFLDADDLWHPAKLDRQVAFLRAHPEVDLCLTRYRNFWAPELADEQERYENHALSQPSSAFNIGTLLARRELFDRTLFNEELRYGENTDWFMAVLRRGARAEVLPEDLAQRRFHAASTTRTSAEAARTAFLDNLKAWRDSRRETKSK
jgi:glycosyltransferase involved in cell wall biosynthesis